MGRVQKIPGGHLLFSLNAPPSWKRFQHWAAFTILCNGSRHHRFSNVPQTRSMIHAKRAFGIIGGYAISLSNSTLPFSTFTAQQRAAFLSNFQECDITQFRRSPINNLIGDGNLRPIQSLASRNFGGSPPPITVTELDEDFESEQAKQVGVPDYTLNDRHNVSLRIEPLRAGILDRDLLRRRRTQPFSDQCWMRSLGVGLYRDKVRNWRSINTAPSYTPNAKQEVGEGECISGNDPYIAETISVPRNGHNSETSKHATEGDNGIEHEVEDISECDTDALKEHARGLIDQGVEDLEAGLKDLESKTHPDDIRIGMVCLRLAQVCDSADEDPEKILSYSSRALRILGSVEESIQTAACLLVMGSAYYKLQKFEKALVELEQAARILEKLERVVGEWELGNLKHNVQFLLGDTNMALEMDEAALENYLESLYVNERLLNPGDPDLAMTYHKVADACLELGRLEEAESMCCKGLQNFQKFFGQDSTQVAMARKLLALIYTELEEYEKVLQEHVKIRPVLVSRGLLKEVASLDLSTTEALFELEKYEEAIPVLENVIKSITKNSPLCSSAMVSLAKSYAKLKKGKDALKWCKKTLDILSNNKSMEAADCLNQLGSVYEDLNLVDEAILIYRKALTIFEANPDLEEDVADTQSKLGALLLFKGKVDEAVPFLKKALQNFKEIFGSENEDDLSEPDGTKLLTLYNHLGIAEIQLEKFDDAVETFERARRLSLRLLGPDDPYTMAVYQNLVSAYPILGRYDTAIEYQQHIVESVRKLGEDALDPLEKVESKLQELIEKSATLTKTQERN